MHVSRHRVAVCVAVRVCDEALLQPVEVSGSVASDAQRREAFSAGVAVALALPLSCLACLAWGRPVVYDHGYAPVVGAVIVEGEFDGAC